MSVVERGAARCPRCMAMADYRFYEDDQRLVHYEVSCTPCGNVHSELCSPPLVESPAA
jgi:hypothetical protein